MSFLYNIFGKTGRLGLVWLVLGATVATTDGMAQSSTTSNDWQDLTLEQLVHVQDTPLEDLDRIEVIRGPGATLWGANAVNGVINIITKSAKDTQGGLLSVTYGTEDQPATTVRYGGQLATNLFYRAYMTYFNRENFVNSTAQGTADS